MIPADIFQAKEEDWEYMVQAIQYISGLSKHLGREIAYSNSTKTLERVRELFTLLAPQHVEGHSKVRMGGFQCDGYVMLDPGRDGIAYSFGVSSHSPWDLEMAQRGFTVYQYDGTIDKEPDAHPNIHFHKYNITELAAPPAAHKNIGSSTFTVEFDEMW